MTTLQEQRQLVCGDTPDTERRRSYVRPAIVHELELETRAGSPLSIDPLDPLNLLDQGAEE